MSYGKHFVIILLFCCFLTGGCGKQEQLETVDRICVETSSEQHVMQTAQDVLGQMQFKIEKADESAGYIRTLPLGGGQFFEVWREDNVGSYNFGESNLHSLRRIVELQVSPQDDHMCVEGTARTYRLSLPESQQLSVIHAFEVFTRSKSELQEFELSDHQKENMAWVELGRDEALTNEILRRIEAAVKEDEGSQG
ncbi:MAG: hypothetical protein ACYSUK_05605 [Planctomycetota bacterium]|jgi:protease II